MNRAFDSTATELTAVILLFVSALLAPHLDKKPDNTSTFTSIRG